MTAMLLGEGINPDRSPMMVGIASEPSPGLTPHRIKNIMSRETIDMSPSLERMVWAGESPSDLSIQFSI